MSSATAIVDFEAAVTLVVMGCSTRAEKMSLGGADVWLEEEGEGRDTWGD